MSENSRNNAPRVMGAVMGTVALVSSGVSFASGVALAQPASDDRPAAAQEQVQNQASLAPVQMDKAEGRFSYTQDVVTPNSTIASVFMTAATSVCASMPQYVASEMGCDISVSAPSGSYVGSVADMSAEEGAAALMMACSCASNVAGGGAIANADVSGVTLETVADLVGAW